MYKRLLVIVFSSLSFFTVKAQSDNIIIEYSVTSKSGSTGKGVFLQIGDHSSLFGKLENLSRNNENAYELKKDEKMVYAVSKNTKLVYKDFSDKMMISDERIVLENFVVKDSLDNFHWKILDEEKEILGYKCKMAKMSFRGRYYVAFFTNKIKKPDGPWKLSGLPGLILEAFTTDQYIHFMAIDIQFANSNMIENPFKNQPSNFLSYKDFKSKYIQSYETLKIGKIREQDGRIVKSEIPKGGIEIYIH